MGLKKTPFWKKVAIYCAVWIAIILISSAVMWNVMLQYEGSQPEYAVDQFLTESRQYIFYYTLMQTYPDMSNEYESMYDVANALSREFGGSLTYARLVREYTYENPVYIVKSDDRELFKLTLEQTEATGIFHFKNYRIKSASLVDLSLASPRSYLLVYPDDTTVYINNKLISDSAKVFSDAYSFGNKNFNTVILENFFAPPEIIVMRGTRALPLAENTAHFVYDYTVPKLRTVTITVPEDAKVSINSTPLDELFIADIITTEPDVFGNRTTLTEYNVPVSDNITVNAEYNEQTFTIYENEGAYTLSPNTYDCTVTVPYEATLYANGDEIPDGLIVDSSAMYTDDFIGLEGYPTAIRYEFSDLYSPPTFTATVGDKELNNIGGKNAPVFVAEASDDLKTTYSELAVDFMKQYLNYTTRGEEETRKNLNAVLALSAEGSLLHNNLKDSYIGYIFIPPQKLEIEYITADNFIPLGESAFLCDVSYKIHLSNFVGDSTEENSFRLTFAMVDGEFAAVNMISK